MKKSLACLLIPVALILLLPGCTLSLLGKPSNLPTLPVMPTTTLQSGTPVSPTPTPPEASPTLSLPTITPGVPLPTIVSQPTPTTGGGLPGQPSGPYAVINIPAGDVLNFRSGPGVDNPASGSFPAGTTTIMRTGPSANVGDDLWVQVQNPAGGTGWVNAAFLTETVASSFFCSDSRVTVLLDHFGSALINRKGEALASLVSPSHGMTVYLWRYGTPHTFLAKDARWVFDSTFEHNWGEAPGSGLETVGSFQAQVLPFLQEVFFASHTLTCDSLGNAAHYGEHPWPLEYANVNYYTVLKPGSPGVDLDFRYWLVGVEYIQGQPYIFAVIHFAWEP
jgi:hypothetical protein